MDLPAPFSNAIVGRYEIDKLGLYLVYCCLMTIGLRFLQSLFKAWAFIHHDVPSIYKIRAIRKLDFLCIWWKHVLGFPMGINNDLWLPTILGFFELAAYPAFIATGQFTVIGVWIGIKTAGSWHGWRTSATAFNRFLAFNPLNLVLGYFV
jgi:hypothetical protein